MFLHNTTWVLARMYSSFWSPLGIFSHSPHFRWLWQRPASMLSTSNQPYMKSSFHLSFHWILLHSVFFFFFFFKRISQSDLVYDTRLAEVVFSLGSINWALELYSAHSLLLSMNKRVNWLINSLIYLATNLIIIGYDDGPTFTHLVFILCTHVQLINPSHVLCRAFQ